ncbi:Organelle RRM domain-containing protein 2 mitochondrial [Bienertia sinuspersici]
MRCYLVVIIIHGLSRRTTTEGLREAFSKFGEVVHAKVVTDRVSGYSKGYGFVRYATTEEASKGIKGMDGQGANEWHPSNVSRKEIFLGWLGNFRRVCKTTTFSRHTNSNLETLHLAQIVFNEFVLV